MRTTRLTDATVMFQLTQIHFFRYLAVSALTWLPLLVSFIVNMPLSAKSLLALFFAYSCLGALIYAVFARYSRILFAVTALILLLASAVSSAFMITNGSPINYQAISATYETNASELIEFIGSSFFKKNAVIVLMILISAGSLHLSSRRCFRLKINHSQLSLALLLSFCLLALVESVNDIADYYPWREIEIFNQYQREVRHIASQYPKQRYRFNGVVDPAKSSNIVLIIGESARKDAFGLYQGNIDTTPALAQIHKSAHMIVYEQAISAAPMTRVSVPSLLSVSPAQKFHELEKYPSIVKIFNAVGYDTGVISNQKRDGLHNSITTLFLADATNKQYLVDVGKKYDGDLTAYLRQAIDSNKRNKLIVVHMYGSHYNYKERYPSQYAYFQPDTLRNQYKNSIRYTDFVVAEIAGMVLQNTEPYVLLYASDHGEYVNDFNDGLYGHGVETTTRFEMEIPFVMIFNQAFVEQHRAELLTLNQNQHKPVSHDNISHTLLGITGIYDRYYDNTFDLSSTDFQQSPRYMITTDMDVRRYENFEFRKNAGDIEKTAVITPKNCSISYLRKCLAMLF